MKKHICYCTNWNIISCQDYCNNFSTGLPASAHPVSPQPSSQNDPSTACQLMALPFSKSFQKPERSHRTCTHSLPPSDLPCPWPTLSSNHSTSAYSLLTQDTPLLAPSTMSSLCSDANSPRMPPLATFSNHSPHSWHALPSFSAKCFSIPAVPVTSLCSSPNCTFCVCAPPALPQETTGQKCWHFPPRSIPTMKNGTRCATGTQQNYLENAE